MKERLPPEESQARFEAVLEKYGRFLHHLIARLCPKDLGLQFSDIEQEARLRLWRALESEKEIISLGSYTYRIAVSVTINAIHKVKARREEQLQIAADEEEGPIGHEIVSDREDSPELQFERKETMEKIERALGRLQENRRLAVGLYLKGLTTEEIAHLLGWTEPKARNLAYRGLKDLRTELRSEGIEYVE